VACRALRIRFEPFPISSFHIAFDTTQLRLVNPQLPLAIPRTSDNNVSVRPVHRGHSTIVQILRATRRSPATYLIGKVALSRATITGAVAYQYEARKSLLSGDTVNQPYVGGYHHREGLGPAPGGLGSRGYKMYRPSTTWTWAFFITVLIQAAIVLAMES
jgi:hypothetical protein